MLASDAERVAELSSELGYALDTATFGERFAALAGASGHALFVAELPEGVVGWTHVASVLALENPPYAEILALITDARVRRAGVGRELVRAAVEWARARGLSTLRVRSNVTREESHRFYPACGFRVLKTQHCYALHLA